MAALSKTVATLRIFGDDIDPGEITFLLGKEPTSHATKGQVTRYPSGSEKTARTGRWNFSATDLFPGNLDAQVIEILSGMPEDPATWQALASKYTIDLFCGLFLEVGNEGIDISPATLKLLGDRRITLSLDIYGH